LPKQLSGKRINNFNILDQFRKYLVTPIITKLGLISFAAFYLSENLDAFLGAFELALLKRGLPRKLYVDNGSAYKSRLLEHICAKLAIALIHAKAYQPQGKGKIERFNVKSSIMVSPAQISC
jgi:transposase InsO family protein